jgi:hypothetical protein
MVAHQKIIRDQRAEEAAGENLFGNWWDSLDTSIKKCELREVNLRTARSIIEEYEYLGTMPNAPIKAFGIYWEGNLGGVIIFGAVSPPSVASSLLPESLSSKAVQLSRGACVHWAHPHSASKLIGYGLKQMSKEGWKLVVAYADPDADEIGTVYQATNWLYCGLTSEESDYFYPDGKRFVGHMKTGFMKTEEGKNLKKGKRTRKHRYVYLLGSKSDRRILRKELKWPVLNHYEKRKESE